MNSSLRVFRTMSCGPLRPSPDDVPVMTTSFLLPNRVAASRPFITSPTVGIFQLDMNLNPRTALASTSRKATRMWPA